MEIKGISQQTQIEAQIGFLIGILIGALSSWVLVMFFIPWEWYFKFFATIGEIGIIGSLSLALLQTIAQRRQYLDAKKYLESEEEVAFGAGTEIKEGGMERLE